ncbi:hypothetical protein BB559_002982 [Furculomyces boomerangus]|uniref:Protein kinase domain-containing protein n=2 Tax=Harpellales TaxID=61421 RepID=A0A2T9YQC0_9FUNG|nr:hypothetical protein BB559_002982 [Furculomyces boomerangus]PVZ97890.1 hypothetical protein BB558_006145 [Smittium angustum]
MLRSAHCSNVVSFLGTTHTPDSVWMVMEYMDEGSLADVLEKYPEIGVPDDVAAYCLRSLLLAVVYLHSCSIIHTDIRSDNILFNSQGVVKLADFGLGEKCFPNEIKGFCGEKQQDGISNFDRRISNEEEEEGS